MSQKIGKAPVYKQYDYVAGLTTQKVKDRNKWMGSDYGGWVRLGRIWGRLDPEDESWRLKSVMLSVTQPLKATWPQQSLPVASVRICPGTGGC